MRFAIIPFLLLCACSKKATPAQAAASKCRDLMNEAAKAYDEMVRSTRRMHELGPQGDDPEKKKAMEDAMAKSQKDQTNYTKARDAAKTAVAEALRANPDDADAIDGAATMAYLTGEFDTAAAHLEKLARLHPDDARIAARRATVLRVKGKYAEARALLKPFIEAHPNEITAVAEDGCNAYFLNDFETAVQRLESVGKQRYSITGPTAFDYGELADEAKRTLDLWKKELELRAAEAKADDLPRVKLETAKGDIILELFENEAPNTVANFVDLVDKQFYDGTRFHNVVPGGVVQGGDPTSRDPDSKEVGGGGPGYCIADERNDGKYRRHFRGSVGLFVRGPDQGGSQFYMAMRPLAHADGKFTVFGRVLEGQEIIDKIEPKDVLTRATILRKRAHVYRPTLKD